MAKTTYAFKPDYAVPPGETLQETIEALGIDQRELAARTGLSPKHINLVIKGTAPITHDTAIRLERVTGVPASMWNNLESKYRGQLALQAERTRLAEDLAWLATIPTGELIARGAIEPQDDKVALLREVLAFFAVASVRAWKEGWDDPRFAFRRSLAVKGKTGVIAAWLRLCELQATEVECRPFDKGRFRLALDKIRAMTVKGPLFFVPRMTDLCQEAGVAFVLEPEIKGAPVSGAAKWLTPTKAMAALNLRGKSNDRFWFTFFHEAGHILNDSKKETFVDVEYVDDPREQNANQFAAAILIPPDQSRYFSALKSFGAVEHFARSIGIAPGIVVGRLQREGYVPYSHLNRLKVRLDWSDE